MKCQDRLKKLLPDGSTGDLLVSKVLSLNLNFSFFNWISLSLISNRLPNCPHEAGWTSFQILYFQKKF